MRSLNLLSSPSSHLTNNTGSLMDPALTGACLQSNQLPRPVPQVWSGGLKYPPVFFVACPCSSILLSSVCGDEVCLMLLCPSLHTFCVYLFAFENSAMLSAHDNCLPRFRGGRELLLSHIYTHFLSLTQSLSSLNSYRTTPQSPLCTHAQSLVHQMFKIKVYS